jgi:hypothetical protein
LKPDSSGSVTLSNRRSDDFGRARLNVKLCVRHYTRFLHMLPERDYARGGPPHEPPRRSGRDCRRNSNRAVGCRSNLEEQTPGRACFATRLGLYAQPTSAVFDLTGKTPRTVDDWVDEHIAKFVGAAAT